MYKFLLVVFLIFNTLLADNVFLYFNMPQNKPSSTTSTKFGERLILLIDNATNSIDFAIYGFRNQNNILNALIKAQKRGVKIRGVVDSDTNNYNYYSDTKLLYKYFNIISDHKHSIMHNKFFIFDKKIVWTGSSNISDTGTGGYNANNVVVIDSENIALLYQKEFNQMFIEKRFQNKKYKNSFKDIKVDNSIISLFFSPKSDTYNKAVKNLITNAKKYIYIPIFYLTHKQLFKDLKDAHKRGVDIKIILDASASGNRYSIHKQLQKIGVSVKIENFKGKMHIKSMIIDDKYFISGSMNYTDAGVNKNDENTLIVYNPILTKKYKKYFLMLWGNI